MAAVDNALRESPYIALPGLGRALILAGKLGQKSAEDIFRKATTNRTSFIAELTGSGAVSPTDLAHTMSSAFAAPLLDLEAIDTQRLPKGLLDAKICQTYRIVVLSKRNNRLIVATADPSGLLAAGEYQSPPSPAEARQRPTTWCAPGQTAKPPPSQ